MPLRLRPLQAVAEALLWIYSLCFVISRDTKNIIVNRVNSYMK
jgi:hypothetical protein